MMKIFIILVLMVNFISFLTMYIDKRKARKGSWRISEKNLFLLAFFMGSPGVLLGMYFFRHKTRHTKFLIGIPLIMILQIFLCYKIITSLY
jgi:uncharacterized membrane protein YsdA (DUF1294 family)